MTHPVPTDPEHRTAYDFAAALTRGDYTAAVQLLTNVANAGDTTLAATLLEGALSAGAEAIHQLTAHRCQPTAVTQTVTTVEAGSIVIGYRADRIG